jgi:acyl-CoA thioester hydrolase
MARIKINLPNTFGFNCIIPIRIGDINYGNHVGNDAVLSIVHEARMQFLKNMGTTELDFFGTSLIMADVAIEFKKEMYYGQIVKASVAIVDISKIGFDLIYKLEVGSESGSFTTALAKTGMICFDYKAKKITSVPEKIMSGG